MKNSVCVSVLKCLLIAVISLGPVGALAQQASQNFRWPEGKKAALSLSFDDARASQVLGGTAFLDKHQVKATFFVVPETMEPHLKGWKQAVANGHEIGNHTTTHPCSGNYLWSRHKAIENYSLAGMRKDIEDANDQIERLLGITPAVFAYPCGQTYVGRGAATKSYVPLVAELFLVGRTYRDKIANDPTFCDFAQLTGIDMDGTTFEDILPILESAKKNGQWVVLGGHEMGDSGPQTTRFAMLDKLLAYAADPANGIWIAPVGTVAEYVRDQRK